MDIGDDKKNSFHILQLGNAVLFHFIILYVLGSYSEALKKSMVVGLVLS